MRHLNIIYIGIYYLDAYYHYYFCLNSGEFDIGDYVLNSDGWRGVDNNVDNIMLMQWIVFPAII